jgi:hypothetical protein
MPSVALDALNAITVIILLAYQVVYLCTVFTTANITTADVPFYQIPSPISTIWTERWYVEFWLLWVDVLMWSYPILSLYTWMPYLPLSEEGKEQRSSRPMPSWFALTKVVFIGVIAIEAAKFIFRIIQLIPAIIGCQDQMFCRSENIASTDTYWLFVVIFIANVLFIFLGGIYIALFLQWERRARFVYALENVAQTQWGHGMLAAGAAVHSAPPPPSAPPMAASSVPAMYSEEADRLLRPIALPWNRPPPQTHLRSKIK